MTANISDLLYAKLDREEWTQVHLADEIGVTGSVLNRWLRDDVMPSSPYCVEIARVLDRPVKDVMQLAGHWYADDKDETEDHTPNELEWKRFQYELREFFRPLPCEQWRPLLTLLTHLRGVFNPTGSQTSIDRLRPLYSAPCLPLRA